MNDNFLVIDVAKDFTHKPYGRYTDDDVQRSAEVFRNDFLIPAIKAGKPFIVDLSGSNRFSSSFLEEAFGGLVREGYSSAQLSLIEVKHDLLPSIVEEVKFYIEQAGL
jgi:hypothetical protein